MASLIMVFGGSSAAYSAVAPNADSLDFDLRISDTDSVLSVDGRPIALETEFSTAQIAGTEALAYVSPLSENAERAGSTAQLPSLGYVSTDEGVTLTWSDFDQRVAAYRIYRNGEFVATTAQTTWSDAASPPGTTNSYQISTEVAPTSTALSEPDHGADHPFEEIDPPAQWAQAQYEPDWIDPVAARREASTANAATLETTTSDSDDATAPRTVTIGTIATRLYEDQSADEAVAEAEAVIMAVNQSTFRYNTFIPSASAPGFPCTWNGGYFGGDNRSWHPEGSSRTRVEVVLPWHTTAQPTFAKSVSPTRAYSSSGQFLEQRTASSADITMRVIIRDVFAEFTQFSVNHYARNPFCPAGGISYQITTSITHTNDYWLEGSHRKAPNHEIYIKPNHMSIWYGVYHLPNAGFVCLTNDAVCGRAPYNKSGNATP